MTEVGGFEFESHNFPCGDPDPCDCITAEEDRTEEMLACLTEAQREVVLLRAAGLTQAEIAQRLGIGQQRVSNRLSWAKKKLEKFL